jgi:uncharacterized protein (DUF2164 family)
MTIELSKEARQEAMESIARYFLEQREEEIGVIAAGGILDFFIAEVGPSIYNKAVADIIQRMQMQVSELDIDFHEQEFQYWTQPERKHKKR